MTRNLSRHNNSLKYFLFLFHCSNILLSNTTLQLFHKKISYRTFWCIMNLTQNITKESAPVRQKHYTTKKHWLVDFINIFWFILKLFVTVPTAYTLFLLIPDSLQTQPVFLCVYRNTYKIKCHDKGLKTADSSTSLSFIKL